MPGFKKIRFDTRGGYFIFAEIVNLNNREICCFHNNRFHIASRCGFYESASDTWKRTSKVRLVWIISSVDNSKEEIIAHVFGQN